MAMVVGLATPAVAQTPAEARRAQATRPELEAALTELEKAVASAGYSKSFRQAREAEAKLVKQRLADGDFQVGDQITITVVGEASLSSTFPVLPGRVLSLPQLPPISLQGVLRSEIGPHLSSVISTYIKDPQVTVQGSTIRLALLGAIGNPGYYTLQADALVTDAIMQAGGPSPALKMEKSAVKRRGEEVITGSEIQRAIEGGLSLDQLNLHGGDELVFGGGGGRGGGSPGGGGNWRNVLWPVQAAISLTFLLTRIF
jgi:protein involved in polysaccharide export with SLBB domain